MDGTDLRIGRRPTRSRRWILGVLGALASLALMPAAVQAGVGASAVPTFPPTVTAGSTGLAASVELSNGNSAGEAGATNTVCNFGTALPCPAGNPGITLIPSCGELGDFSACTAAGADPDVFKISSTATGVAGTACAGMVFDVTQFDATFGRLRFTPRGGSSVVLLGTGTACRIAFTFNVLRVPTVDLDANSTNGVQTVQVTDNTQSTGALTASARGTSTGTTVLRPTSIATQASGDIVVGGVLTDRAVVSGRVNPSGGSVEFRLYGPDDANCLGTPLFSSTQPLDADGTATSAPVGGPPPSPPLAPGVYRWIAIYSGDANNAGVSGACNEANETVTVSPPSSQSAAAPAGAVSPATAAKPRIQVRGVLGTRGKCTGSTFRLRVTAAGTGIERVRVTLDGKTIGRSTRPSFSVKVRARAMAFGRHVLRVIATGAGGRTTRTVAFKRCGSPTLPRFVG